MGNGGLRKRSPEYVDARRRRIERLKREIAEGTYCRPADAIAEGFLFGPPKWGEAFIDEEGRRLDEVETLLGVEPSSCGFAGRCLSVWLQCHGDPTRT